MVQHEWEDETRQLAIAPRLWLRWTLATTIAGAIVGALEASGFQFMATIFFTGLLIGAAQWLVLRQYISKAFWWIVVSTLGWTFGLLLVSSFITPLFDPLIPFLRTLGAWPGFWWILVSALGGALDEASGSTIAYILPGLLPPPFSTALSYGAGWLSYGIITGFFVQWQLRYQPR